jgi:hypothetical protein
LEIYQIDDVQWNVNSLVLYNKEETHAGDSGMSSVGPSSLSLVSTTDQSRSLVEANVWIKSFLLVSIFFAEEEGAGFPSATTH